MELVRYEDGAVAPRLSDVTLNEEEALADFATMIRNIVRMLCSGIVHGDLSEFNVLLDADGPVVIELPQAVDAAANNQPNRCLYGMWITSTPTTASSPRSCCKPAMRKRSECCMRMANSRQRPCSANCSSKRFTRWIWTL